MANKLWINAVLSITCLTVLHSCQKNPSTNQDSFLAWGSSVNKPDALLQDLRETTYSILSSLYQVEHNKFELLREEGNWMWPWGEKLQKHLLGALQKHASYKNKKLNDLNIEDILFLLNTRPSDRYDALSYNHRGVAFYRSRLVDATRPNNTIGEVDTYFGPSTSWPKVSVVQGMEASQNDSIVDHRWKGKIDGISGNPDNYFWGTMGISWNYYNTSSDKEQKGLKIPSDLSQKWPLDKWKSEGWITDDEVYVHSNQKAKRPDNKYALYQYLPYGFHTKFKGGDQVNFKVWGTCPDLDTSPSDTDSKVHPIISLSTNVREIRDDVVIITNKKSFKTKTAFAWAEPSLLGTDPNCVVGNAVYAEDGNLYGVITGYLPKNDKELDANLEITTVQDERMVYLFKYWYQELEAAPSQRVSRSTNFVATKPEDRFDPTYLSQLNSEEALVWAAIQRVKFDACQNTLSPEQMCEKEVKVLRDARNRLQSCRTPIQRILPKTIGPVQCSMAQRTVRLSCSRP